MGVNKYTLEKEDPVEVLSIDNSKVLAVQKGKLEKLYSSRDQGAVDAALHQLTQCAAGKGGNLLDLSIKVRRHFYAFRVALSKAALFDCVKESKAWYMQSRVLT